MHWFSIINSILIVLFLSFMVAMILVRTLNRDISKYNRLATDEEKVCNAMQCNDHVFSRCTLIAVATAIAC